MGAQVYVGTLIILTFATMHVYFRPFQAIHEHHSNGTVEEHNTLQDLESYSFIAGTMTLYLGRSLLLVDPEGPLKAAIAITIFVVNVLFMLIALKHFLACLAHENSGKIHSLEKHLHLDNKRMQMFDHLLDIDEEEEEKEKLGGAVAYPAQAAAISSNADKQSKNSETINAVPVETIANWGAPSQSEEIK